MNYCVYCEQQIQGVRNEGPGVKRANETTCARCFSRLQRNGSVNGHKLTREEFKEEFEFLHSQGLNFEQIIDKLGMSDKGVLRAMRKSDVSYTDREIEMCVAWIKKYALQGIEFTADSLPFVSNPNRTYQIALNKCMREGIVSPTGGRKSSRITKDSRMMIYRG